MELRGIEAHFVGLDIGRVTDYSALAVIARRFEVPNETDVDMTRQNLVLRYYIVYLQRFPLDTEYLVIENETVRIWGLPELMVPRKFLLVDQTGVGAPIVEALRRRHIYTNGIVITSGQTVSHPAPNEYHVPQAALVTNLARLTQGGRLKILEGVAYQKEFVEEMDNFGYKTDREKGTVTYESLSEQMHDDLVIAVAMGVWYGEAQVPPTFSGKPRPKQAAPYDPLGRR